MKKISVKLQMILVLMLTFVLVSCTPATTTAKNVNTKENIKTESKITTYPYQAKAMDKTVTIDKEPTKILSLAPTVTETIFAMGKGANLVGRTDYCDYPQEATKLPSVGTITNPSIEKIVSLKPDVVIASMMKAEVKKKIEEAGIKVVALKNGDSINGSYENMREIARIINAQDKTEEIIKSIDAKIKTVSDKVSSANPKINVYYVVGYGKNGDFTAGDKTFINDLISKAGAVNVATDAQGWKYTSEKLMAKNPDMIFMGKMSKSKEGFISSEPYKNLKAVKDGKVYEVDDNLINREGPRMGEAVEMLAKLFYPSLMK